MKACDKEWTFKYKSHHRTPPNKKKDSPPIKVYTDKKLMTIHFIHVRPHRFDVRVNNL